MLTEQQLNAIANFMQRVDIKPTEIVVWQDAMMALGKEVELTRARQQSGPEVVPEGTKEPGDE